MATDGKASQVYTAIPTDYKSVLSKVSLYLEGASMTALLYIGHQLKLYEALAKLEKPITSQELANLLQLKERWVREWLLANCAAGFVTYYPESAESAVPKFCLLDGQKAMAKLAGASVATIPVWKNVELTASAFRTGKGLDYDVQGVGISQSLDVWNLDWQKRNLVSTLKLMEGVIPKLEAGCKVADVGCGYGTLLTVLAKQYPNTQFYGYDISKEAIKLGQSLIKQAKITNITLTTDPLPEVETYDLLITWDCIHDMTRPDQMMKSLRKALKHDGAWLLVDIATEEAQLDIFKNPMAASLYASSVTVCMSSGLSTPDGLGLGTLGLKPSVIQKFAHDAGFASFRRLNIEHPVQAFYEIRPRIVSSRL